MIIRTKILLYILFISFFIASCEDNRKVNLDSGLAKYGPWTTQSSLQLVDSSGNLDQNIYVNLSSEALSLTTNNFLSVFFIDTTALFDYGKKLGGLVIAKADVKNSALFTGKFYDLAKQSSAQNFTLLLPAKKNEFSTTNPSVEMTIGNKKFIGRLQPDSKKTYFLSEMDFQSNGKIGATDQTKSDANNNGFFEDGLAYAFNSAPIFTGGGGCKIIAQGAESENLNIQVKIKDEKNFAADVPVQQVGETVEDLKVRKQAYENLVKAWHNSSSSYEFSVIEGDGACKLKFDLTKDEKILTPTYAITNVSNVQSCDTLKNLSTAAYQGMGSSFRQGVELFGRFKAGFSNDIDGFYLECTMYRRLFKN